MGPGLTRPTYSIRYRDRRFDETEILGVDSTFLDQQVDAQYQAEA